VSDFFQPGPNESTGDPDASPASGRAVIPLIAIVGRPNVGKSTIFNRLVGQRRSIVTDEPGVTRDRIYGEFEWSGVDFEVVDTGGILPGEETEIPQKIYEQARVAIETAALLVLVVDGRAGLTGADEALAQLIRASSRPVFLAVNKIDSEKQSGDSAEFMRLGFEHVFPVSAEHGRGFTELLDAAGELVASDVSRIEQAREVRVSIVGRPNAGKSTLLNRLVGEERSMVSPVAGTTRDAVDSIVEHDGVRFRFIDTAGIRRRARSDQPAERISIAMARKHLELSDVALLVLDGAEPLAAIDATIGGYAHEAGRSVIIVVNKWDVVEKGPTITADFERRIREKFKYLDYAPIVFISAKTGQRVDRLYALAAEIWEERGRRIGTGELNQFLKEVRFDRGGLPSDVKIRYIAQVRVAPPTFVVFSNSSKKFHFSFERYLVNQIRRRFAFVGTPIIIKQRSKTSRRSGIGRSGARRKTGG
jgi:GTP-binding protein